MGNDDGTRFMIEDSIADSDEAGHAFQSEAGHLFRSEAGRDSDLMSATARAPLRVDEMILCVGCWVKAEGSTSCVEVRGPSQAKGSSMRRLRMLSPASSTL